MAVEKMFGPLQKMPLKKVCYMHTQVVNKRKEIIDPFGLHVSTQGLDCMA
jgi:hypothetical protein